MVVIHSLYREAGTVTIDKETCTLCGQCAKICPAEVLTLEDGGLRVSPDSPFDCIACGHCMMICPEGSITVTGRGMSPEDLLPNPDEAGKATADALRALMCGRRSIRHFQEREVEPELLERIVEMAASAPMGIPPWDVGCVTVCGRERVRELADDIVKGYEGFLKMFRPWVLTVMRPFMKRATHDQFKTFIRPLAEMYVGNHKKGRDALFYDAPAVLVFHHSPYADTADAMIACTYAMLVAESLGLGTTMIGGAAPILQRNRELCNRLGVPPGNTAAIAMILGYPAVKFRRTVRRRFSHTKTVK